MDAFDVQKHWQSMDWHVNWNIVSVQHQRPPPLYRHFHRFLLVIGLDLATLEAAAAAVVVDNLVVISIVVAHMFQKYHQFVRKPTASVWLAVVAVYPMMMMMMQMHVVQLKLK